MNYNSSAFVLWIVRLFTLLVKRWGYPQEWAHQAIRLVLQEAFLEKATANALWWWMVEGGCHLNPLWHTVPSVQRAMFTGVVHFLTAERQW